MILFREIMPADDKAVAKLVRSNLKAYGHDLPGTVYYDDGLDHLSGFYLMSGKKRYYCIAEEDGRVVGGIGLAEFDFFDDCAEMQKLYLDDSVKGKGIGYRLIGKIEEKALELGYKKLYLETHTSLQAAIHIYEKCGYTEIEKPAGVVHAAMDRFFMKEL